MIAVGIANDKADAIRPCYTRRWKMSCIVVYGSRLAQVVCLFVCELCSFDHDSCDYSTSS
jgi:hypothetical protein